MFYTDVILFSELIVCALLKAILRHDCFYCGDDFMSVEDVYYAEGLAFGCITFIQNCFLIRDAYT